MTVSISRQKSREHSEKRLLEEGLDFSGSYMAIKDIRANLETIPDTLTRQTFESISRTVRSEKFDSQRQAFFLHREAVETLVSPPFMQNNRFAADSIRFLQDLLIHGNRNKKRAVYESLGSLEGSYDNDLFRIEPCSGSASVSLDTVFENLGAGNCSTALQKGRSLLQKTPDGRLHVVKLAQTWEEGLLLHKEACWMDRLQDFSLQAGVRFDPPRPLELNGCNLFTLRNQFHGFSHAIAYTACPEYFAYPNAPHAYQERSSEQIRSVFSQNAWILGKLASTGIVHTAVIPLFHNRIQQGRRDDRGRYDWEHGGRLDQWLESCRYPNIAFSGLRDFEHLEFVDRTRSLKRSIGEHLLSLILVAGSFFRNRNPGLKGYDARGGPADARHLFDPRLLESILHDIIHSYGAAFTGSAGEKSFSGEINLLAGDLIREMGVDRHMEEVLRVEDQNRLDAAQFRDFLRSRGIGQKEIAAHEADKGKENLSISTGPHLGGFNQAISVPSLIDLLFTLSALFVSERYLVKNGFKPYSNSGRLDDQPVSRVYDTPF